MKYLVLGFGVAIFVAIALAVKFHFKSSGSSGRFTVLSVLSGINIFVFGRELLRRQQSVELLSTALVLFLAAAALFTWAIMASKQANLKLIYETDNPSFVLKAGPYAFIRHPFYTSYFIFWFGCALAAPHPVTAGFFVILVVALTMSAQAEEKSFEGTPRAVEYAQYRKAAGLFWPKLRAGGS
jgi:protein-S-isoprenylcysteine O-methyltransferase Ste14